jgi:hypothetical protein
MHFLMTNDVESFSIPRNREDSEITKQIYEVGLPRLLDLLSKHDIQSTFYFTGMFAEQSPESVELVKEHGHEIGCHGYDHSPQRAFDVLSYEEQVNELKKGKERYRTRSWQNSIVSGTSTSHQWRYGKSSGRNGFHHR